MMAVRDCGGRPLSHPAAASCRPCARANTPRAEGNQVKERQLCLEAVIEGGDLQFNYTETKDGCPVGTDRFRATRVPTQLIPGVGDAQEC